MKDISLPAGKKCHFSQAHINFVTVLLSDFVETQTVTGRGATNYNNSWTDTVNTSVMEEMEEE